MISVGVKSGLKIKKCEEIIDEIRGNIKILESYWK